MDGQHYKVRTIFDMAAIPPEAVERFISELPSMLAEIRKVNEMAKIFAAVGVTIDAEGTADPVWIDDDKGEATVTLIDPAGDSVSITSKIK